MSKIKIAGAFALFLLLALPTGAEAFSIKTDSAIYINPEESIEGNLYALGSNIVIDGSVSGDVICAGQSIEIKGSVGGDVICAGQSINISGSVNGDLRLAANAVNVNSFIARNVTIAAATAVFGKDSVIGRDAFIAVATADLRGKISGELHGSAASANISGEISKNVNLKLNRRNEGTPMLFLADTARLGGNLIYFSEKKASVMGEAKISGETIHNLPPAKNERAERHGASIFWRGLFSVFSSLIIGLVLISLWPKKIEEITDKMMAAPKPAYAWGLTLTILAPLAAVIIAFTIIGLPLAFILFAVWIAFLWIGKILTGVLLGREFLKKYWKDKKKSLLLAMTMGVITVKILFLIPVLGALASVAATWWGIGGAYIYLKGK